MNGSAWVGMIKRIPEAQHDILVAVTSTGAEIMVQKIMVLEEEFMIFRGRPAGSADAARIVLLPFDQLNLLAFGKPLQEAEIQKMFGHGSAAVFATPAQAAPEKPAQESAPAEHSPDPAPTPQETPTADAALAKPAPPSKSILLARLRARLANS